MSRAKRPVHQVSSQADYDQLVEVYRKAAQLQRIAKVVGYVLLLIGFYYGVLLPTNQVYHHRAEIDSRLTSMFFVAFLIWKWPQLCVMFAGAAVLLLSKGRELGWFFLGPFVMLFTDVPIPKVELVTDDEKPSILSALRGTSKPKSQ